MNIQSNKILKDFKKENVRDFWEEAACGERLYLTGKDTVDKYIHQLQKRYELEPFILPFADFKNWNSKKVLEIGVGLGADHEMFARNKADLYGIDLTERAVSYTKERMQLFGLKSNLRVGDAENLPYPNSYFDMVYSWGVIHHSPNTKRAIHEILRVLKPGGTAKIMIYHKYSMVGFMLWIRYALLSLRPYKSLDWIYANFLESPGTKAYSVKEAIDLFKKFHSIKIQTLLGHGDLLTSRAGQRHKGFILDMARKIYPRFFIKKFFPKNGLFMLIDAVK